MSGPRQPPFDAGNEVATTHGADSERRIAPIAEQLRQELVTAAPWCNSRAFAAGVAGWSRAEARVRLLVAWLDDHGLLDDDGKPRPALHALESAERTADRMRQELGLTPRSWATLLRTASTDPDGGVDGAAALKAAGWEMLAARDAAALPATSEPSNEGNPT